MLDPPREVWHLTLKVSYYNRVKKRNTYFLIDYVLIFVIKTS